MAAGDLHNNVRVVRVISPHSPAATGLIAGQVVDRAGYANLEFVFQSGTQTTSAITMTPVVMHSAQAATGFVSAPDSALLGTEAGVNTALGGGAGSNGANKVAKLGYIGSNRYVRCDFNVLAGATGTYNVVAVQTGANKAPVA